MARAYIGASLEDDLRLRGLRDEIYNSINSPRHYKKKTPHITIIPAFSVDPEHRDRVEELVHSSSLPGTPVRCENLAVWKNISVPRVVMLNVDVNIEDERHIMMSGLREIGVDNIPDPVSPHITLFKKYSTDVETPRQTRKKIQEEIYSRHTFPDTRVLDTFVDFKEES